MFYILYETTNKVNGKIYVGIHQTQNLDDGYLGSGAHLKKAIKKYGRENFDRKILMFCKSYEELSTEERSRVDKDFCQRRDTYNSEIGGRGGKVWTDEMRKNMSIRIKNEYKNGRIHPCLGKEIGDRLSADGRQRLKNRMKGNQNPMFGKNVADIMSEEANKIRLQKISVANRKPKKNKEKYSENAKNRRWLIHRSGSLHSTVDPNDPRFNHPDWQKGKKWR